MMPAAAAAAGSRPFAWLVGLLERLDCDRPDLVRVLTYHHVEPGSPDLELAHGVSVAPEAFAEQMRYLKERCHVVTISEVLRAIQNRGGLPRRAVLITFDDGYRDFAVHAWPVLRSLGLPAVLFVPTAFPGDPGRTFWWDQLAHAVAVTSRRQPLRTSLGMLELRTAAERRRTFRALRAHAKRLPHAEAIEWLESIGRELDVPPRPPELLSWDELRELTAEGLTVGSHTRTHPLLTRIAPECVREEVRESFRDLERELGSSPPILAYPAGAFDERVARVAREEGVALGFTTRRGINHVSSADPLALRRINVGRRTSLALLRTQFMAWSSMSRPSRA